jgi:S-sulfosulfanyl-L-cysteine sulfohydrolase
MVRVGGMAYKLKPGERVGSRVSDMRIDGKPLQPTKRYKVAGWAPVAEGITGEPVWDVVERYLRDAKSVRPRVKDNPVLT